MNPWENKTVVIVDDMDHVRTELESTYRNLGLNIVGMAKDGLEAIDLVQQVKPDLVSMDIIMPNMDGMECFNKIAELKDPPKILFVTYLANEPKFIDAYRNRIAEELFMPKGCPESVFRSRLNFIFGDGSLLNENPSLHEKSGVVDEASFDFE